MIIRNITPEDAVDIYRIEREAFPDPWSEDGIASECANSLGIALAAVENGLLTGYIFGECDGENGYISHIAVDAAYRRRGTARALMTAFLEHIPSDTVLEVRRSNLTAISFYENMGFERIGIRKNFYSVPGREDAVVMQKTVTNHCN